MGTRACALITVPGENKYRHSASSGRFGETRPTPESAKASCERLEGQQAPRRVPPKEQFPRFHRSATRALQTPNPGLRELGLAAHPPRQGRPAHQPRPNPKARPAAQRAKPREPSRLHSLHLPDTPAGRQSRQPNVWMWVCVWGVGELGSRDPVGKRRLPYPPDLGGDQPSQSGTPAAPTPLPQRLPQTGIPAQRNRGREIPTALPPAA